MDQKKRKFGKVLWRWLISYMIIMIIPLVFGAVIYIYSLHTIKDHAEALQRQEIAQASFNLDNMTENLYSVSYAMSSSAYTSGIYKDNGTAWTSMSAAQVQKTMESYRVANNHIQSIYMYFPDNDYLLTNRTFYQYHLLGDQAERYLELTEDEFQKLKNTSYGSGFVLYRGPDGVPDLYYVCRFQEFRGKMITFMRLDTGLLKTMVTISNSGVWLLAGNEPFWVSGIQTDIPEALMSQDALSGEHRQEILYTDRYMWMCQSSDQSNHSLLICTDLAQYSESLRGMQRILIIYLIMSFAVAGLLAWFFARRNYRPVQTLMEGVDPDYLEKGQSEYSIITDYYKDVQTRYKSSRRELQASRTELRDSRMARLLHGKPSHVHRRLKEMEGGEAFIDGRYVLVTVSVLDNALQDADEILNMFILENVTTEILSRRFKMLTGWVDGFLVYIVRFKKDNAEMEWLNQGLEYACFYLEQNFHLWLTVNISRESDDITNLNKSFDETKSLQEYRDWVESDPLHIRSAANMYYPEEEGVRSLEDFRKYREMQTCLKEGNYAAVDAMLQSLMAGQEADSEEGPEDRGKASRKTRMVEEISDYIEKHYDDWQLSGKMFADRYQVSLSYLSTTFKKEKNIGLLDYINKIRYTKAKEMIDQGMTIQEAAKRAGYATAQPLRRLFRQFEGVTPSQSRKKKTE